jgi:hypothetical protein
MFYGIVENTSPVVLQVVRIGARYNYWAFNKIYSFLVHFGIFLPRIGFECYPKYRVTPSIELPITFYQNMLNLI